ncbi:response regulator transcription factor [Caulobacter sp. NIBR1757]|uniref:response regulator transcription factor n=1 Tax=Caulobacter sp. NIBR1757 TaxID=3016000 RepID=UPI0022F0D157|nr:response regulator transcription factor [Caulobacter sp. NIBR1757]WGM41085.1 Aerobic respiration control protein ArcA [Caulobacter sp. NIBR1757]
MSASGFDDLRVLLVDRDPHHRQVLAERLQLQDCAVAEAGDRPEMALALEDDVYSAIVCDLEPSEEPDQRALRDLLVVPGRPVVILLGSRDNLIDRLLGLELGADDYMAKPVNARELVARLKAVLRGRRGAPGPVDDSPGQRLLFAGYQLDLDGETLRDPAGCIVRLPRAEFLMLRALAEQPGKVVARARLQAVSSSHDWTADSRAVDLRISRLRRRLSMGGEIIRTFRGRGYLLAVEVRPAP